MKILQTIIFLSLNLFLVLAPTVSANEWSATSHEVFEGDYNNDSLSDIYLKALPSTQSIPIPYDINIDVDLATGNKDLILQNNGDGTYSLIYNPPPASIAAVTWVPSTTHELVFGDFNGDGVQDVLVQATSVGDASLAIYAPDVGAIPTIAKTITRTQIDTNEDVTARTAIDSGAGNSYSLGSNGDYVGTIQSSFGVSSSGKPNYRIPLNLVPRVRDVIPELGLVYSGNSGNSILGVGWYIDGLSKIERCPTTIDQDSYINGVNFNSSDKFCLNGQRLIAVNGTYGADQTEYRTENESFTRVISYGTVGNGPQYFKVKHTAGEIEEYGNTANSRRSTAQSNASVVTWAINKISDREGNYATYTYTTNNSAGSQYIDEINYTGNSTAGLAANNRVQFIYESRTDITPSYANGVKSIIPVRVDRINTYLGTSLVRSYDLNYAMGSATSRSRLTAVKECLSDGKCLPSTVFTWDPGNEDVIFTKQAKETDTTSYPSALTYENQQYHSADVNGDGRSDLIWTYRHTNELGRVLYLANSTGNGFTRASKDVETGFTASTIPDADQSYMAGDVNGDGNADLVWVARYLDDLYYVIYLANSSGTGFISQGFQVDSQSDHALYSDGHYNLADVNGDGRKDLVWTFVHQNKLGRAVYLAYTDSSGNLAFGKVSYDIDSTYTPEYYTHNQYTTGDVNGDGKEDFLWTFELQGDLYRILYLANANGTGFNKISVQKDSGLHAAISQYDDSKIQLADANADGKSDIVWTYTIANQLGRTLYLASDLGTSFSKKSSVLGKTLSTTATNKDASIADFNGDGRSDILFTYNGTNTFGWVVYTSDTDGEGFTESQSDTISMSSISIYENQHYLLGDTNADGKTDLIWAYNNINTHDLERIRYTLPASHPDHITGITDGFGNQTNIQYRYLADTGSGFYTKGTSATYPVRDDEGLSYVVEQVQKSDGIGGLNQWGYAYEGARTHLQGRGFLGFEKRIITDQQTGFITTESYRQEFPYIGMQESVVVTKSDGSPIEKVYNHWKQAAITHAGGKDTAFRYLADTAALKYNLADGNLVFASLTDDSYTPSLGNLDQRVVVTGTGFTGPIDASFQPDGTYNINQVTNTERNITTGFSYLNDTTANWRIGFLESKTETYSVPSTPSKAITTQYTPINSTSFLTQSETQFAGSDVWINNTYTRDNFGNITSVIATAADITGTIAPRQTTFGTYIAGMYPSSKTNPLSHVEQYQYNQRIGELSQRTDANTLITDQVYDDFGRLVYSKVADGSDTRTILDYCTTGCQTNEKYKATTTVTHLQHAGIMGSPSVTSYYDSFGRELRTDTTGFGGETVRTTTQYDNQGRVVQKSQPYIVGNTPQYSQYTYDDLSRVTLEQQAGGGTTQNVYLSDPIYASRTTSTQTIQVPAGGTKNIVTVLKRNSLEQLAEVIDDHGTPTHYSYDAQGNSRTVQVNNDSTTTITVETDIAGNKTHLIDPDAGEITYSYNGAGELRRKVFDPSGLAHSITTTRDALGRTATRTDDDGQNTEVSTWSWDQAANGKGMVSSISGPDYLKTYQYDDISRTKQTETKLFNEANPKISQFTYDGFSRSVKTVYPSGLGLKTSYNDNGYTSKQQDTKTGAVYWKANSIDAFGNVTNETYGNGLTTLRTYDPATGRIASLRSGPSANQTKIQDLSYQFDTAGNLNSRSSNRALTGGESLTESFVYDDLHRVTGANTGGLGSGGRNLAYGYDALGNIKDKTGVSDTNGYHYGESGAGPHAVSRIVKGGATTTYAYDNKGNMSSDGSRTIGYTVFNKPDRITKAGIETLFSYGPQRNRFYQQHTDGSDVTKTWYYGGFELVEKNGTIREKTYLGDYLVHNVVRQTGSQAAGADLRYLHRDHIGSVESITDKNGNELERMAFAPFGSRRQANWEESDATFEAELSDKTFNTTTHGFTDHEHIDSVGIIHMNGRIYDPAIGRFLSPDDFVQFPEFSQSYNRYSYVLNNPLTHTDESGEFVPLVIYGAVLAYRAYSAHDTVTSGVADVKTLASDSASTSDKVISGVSLISSIAGGKVAREGVGMLAKKLKNKLKKPKRESADKVKGSKPDKSKGNDGNTENVKEKPKEPEKKKGPKPNEGEAKPHGGEKHNEAIDKRIEKLKEEPAVENIRKNQQQVDVEGNNVGKNRPDVQYDKDSCHHCVEYDTVPKNSTKHGEVIKQNDSKVKVELNEL